MFFDELWCFVWFMQLPCCLFLLLLILNVNLVQQDATIQDGELSSPFRCVVDVFTANSNGNS
jgi:hypothetical protein